MKKLIGLSIGCLLLSLLALSQIHEDKFTYEGNTFNYKANKESDRYTMTVDASAPVKSSKKEKDIYGFYYNAIKKDLTKKTNSSTRQLIRIERFAKNFASAVKEKSSSPRTLVPLEALPIDHYQLQKFLTDKEEYLFILFDTNPEGSIDLDILRLDGGVYKYNPTAMRNDIVLNNWRLIQNFIKKNKSIKTPKVSLIQIDAQDKLYFENADNSRSNINISTSQADVFRKNNDAEEEDR